MRFEQPRPNSTNLAEKFKQVRDSVENAESEEVLPFAELEAELHEAGFHLADTSEVIRNLNTDTLLCRSESFTKVLDLLHDQPVLLKNPDSHANMCIIASGAGFKTAMEEGFSGSDVGAMVKTVLTFEGNNLTKRNKIAQNDELWQHKPTTAQVSLCGEGAIESADVVMVSFRFPVKYLAEDILTESELDLLEDDALQFIVRHYVREAKTATH